MLAAGVTSAAGLSIALAGDYFKPCSRSAEDSGCTGVPYRGCPVQRPRIEESVRVNVVMTVIELSELVLVIVVAAVVIGRGEGDPGRLVQFSADAFPRGGNPRRLAAGLLLLCWL